jgi:hypothetical protein
MTRPAGKSLTQESLVRKKLNLNSDEDLSWFYRVMLDHEIKSFLNIPSNIESVLPPESFISTMQSYRRIQISGQKYAEDFLESKIGSEKLAKLKSNNLKLLSGEELKKYYCHAVISSLEIKKCKLSPIEAFLTREQSDQYIKLSLLDHAAEYGISFAYAEFKSLENLKKIKPDLIQGKDLSLEIPAFKTGQAEDLLPTKDLIYYIELQSSIGWKSSRHFLEMKVDLYARDAILNYKTYDEAAGIYPSLTKKEEQKIKKESFVEVPDKSNGYIASANSLELLFAFIMVPLSFLFLPAVLLLLSKFFLKRKQKKRMKAILKDHLPLSSLIHLGKLPLNLYFINDDATTTLYGKLVENNKPFNYSFCDNVKEYTLIDKGDIFIIGDFQQSMTDGLFYNKTDNKKKLYIKKEF